MTKGNEPLQLFRLSEGILETLSIDDVSNTISDMIQAGVAYPPYPKFAVEINSKVMFWMMKNGWKDLRGVNPAQLHVAKRTLETDIEHKYLFEYDIEINANTSPTFVDDLSIQEKIKRMYKSILYEGKKIYSTGQIFNIQDMVDLAFLEKGMTPSAEGTNMIANLIFSVLMVLLATKNIEKNEILNKQLMSGKFNKAQAYRKDYPITTTLTIGKITENHESVGTGSTVRPHLRRGHIRNQHYGPNNEMTKKIFIQPVFVNADEGWVANREAYNVRMAS